MPIAHERLYAELRRSVLSRHFALGRYWRANHFTNENYIGEGLSPQDLPTAGTRTVPCWQDRGDGRPEAPRWGIPERVSHSLDEYERLVREQQPAVERWRVMRHDRTNALLMTGLRLIGLCAEHRLGHPHAARIVNLVLDTMGSLCKFNRDNSPFGGYILRWDPATSDEWEVKVGPKGEEAPQICCQFLVNQNAKTFQNSHFLYCTPLTDPRYQQARAVDHGQDRYRRWEPSMDEYVGLVGAYMLVFDTFTPAADAGNEEALAIIKKVVDQTKLIGRYLQHVGYLLVRPCGGFANRGAAGPNPAYEYAFSRAFKRITNDTFAVPSTATFDKAVDMAGLSAAWQRSPLASLPAALAALRSSPAWPSIESAFGPDGEKVREHYTDNTQHSLVKVVEVLLNVDQFDVAGDRTEFVIGRIFKDICLDSPQNGFEIFMRAAPQRDAWSDYHKPFIGLMAIGDPSDIVVRDEYLKWYDAFVHPWEYRNEDDEVMGIGTPQPGSNEPGPEPWSIPTLATAVAAMLRADDAIRRGPVEDKLRRHLHRMRTTLEEKCRNDLVVSHLKPPGRDFDTVAETHDKRGCWHGYMAPLALAWLYQLRPGVSPMSGVPVPSAASIANWPAPVVPAPVIRAVEIDRMPVPLRAIRRNFVVPAVAVDVDLFEDAPPKPSDTLIGNVPEPRPGVTRRLEFLSMPPATSDHATFELPLPPALPIGLDPNDYQCVAAWDGVSQSNVRRLSEGREGNKYVVRIEFSSGFQMISTPPYFVYRTGRFKGDCTPTWVRTAPLP